MSQNTNTENVDLRMYLNIWKRLDHGSLNSKIKIIQSKIDQLNSKDVYKVDDLKEMMILCDLRRAFHNLENALEQANEYYKTR